MPILDLQRRLREAGRIRIGEQVPTNNGKTRPSKLEVFRLTSADEQSIRAAAIVYGGEVKEWSGAPVGEQWELYTEAKALDVIVPPVDLAWSQWMELWSGGGCSRRCDGQTNVLNDQPCSCDPDAPDCKPTTRLGVILRDLDGIGIWRLEIHGWNGAQELLGAVEVLRTLQARGQMVPARLLLEQRQTKRDGKTFNFGVPVLDLRLSVAALTNGAASSPQLTPSVTPIQQDPDEGPLPSVSEQVEASKTPAPRKQSARSAATLPATGLAPRPANAVPDVTQATQIAQPARSVTLPTPGDDRTPGGASKRSVRRLFALLSGLNIKTDEDRYAWATNALGVKVESYNDLSQDQITALNDAAEGKPVPSEPDEAVAYSDEPF